MNDEIIMGENPIVDPVVDPVVDPAIDLPVDDVTLAPTDDVIPAPVDCPISAECPAPTNTVEGISAGASGTFTFTTLKSMEGVPPITAPTPSGAEALITRSPFILIVPSAFLVISTFFVSVETNQLASALTPSVFPPSQ